MTEQRLIDANELLTAFQCGETVRTECVRATIGHMPTIEERKTGKWKLQTDRRKKHYGWNICSECGKWIGEPTNYCPNCGAEMKGE